MPVFLLGIDDGLNPAVLRRDSEEFREVVFSPLAKALARSGIRAIGEEPFWARFKVDGTEGERGSRWESDDFLYYAREVAVDDLGNTAPYLVFVDIWKRTCRDDETLVCIDVGASVHDSASGEPIVGAGLPEVRIPIPPGCEGACLGQLWHARSEALLHPLGAALGGFISKHLAHGTSRGGE